MKSSFGTKPMSEKDHILKDCPSPMGCSICMSRCYDDGAGHVFFKGEQNQCVCGKFKNMDKALEKIESILKGNGDLNYPENSQ